MTENLRNPIPKCEPWHALDDVLIYEKLATSIAGISTGEAQTRISRFGYNQLPLKGPPPLWTILIHQVKNPLIIILIFAAALSAAIGDATDSLFIMIVVALNSCLGAFQEYNAEKSAASLQNLLKLIARVRRSSKEFDLPSEELVPGDIVLLESGQKVPADLRLTESRNLSLDESFLTGESRAVVKNIATLPENTGITERFNMAYAGSTVMSGRATGIVVATGILTEVGQIARLVSESESAKPPLVTRMDRFTHQVGLLVLLFSLILAAILYSNGYEAIAIFFMVVALAVSAIPEGLPVALTVALSIAVSRMSKRNVIVRSLPAVESLGSCTVIASDKTGTLTVNQQTARQVVLTDGSCFGISGQGYHGDGDFQGPDNTEISIHSRKLLEEMAVMAMLANEATLGKEDGEWFHLGDAIDVAILAMGHKLGIESARLKQEAQVLQMIPYESERRFSAVFYRRQGIIYAAAKGAVETILDFCSQMSCQGKSIAIEPGIILNQAEAMARQGYRVLAVAGTELAEFKQPDPGDNLPSLEFKGLIGFIDPLRPEALEAIEKCRTAGIKVIMITGDHPSTALAIARDLGMASDGQDVVSGHQLDSFDRTNQAAWEKFIASTSVFARVSPANKMEIVDALISQGEFVAVTGDGVNDAPALHRANIGVAMGSGTDVAKDISSMIVADDNFASIVSGVEEGRYAYDNVRKVTYLLISTGAAELLLFFASVISGMPIPLMAVQLLWLNLVTNGIQDVALAFEGGEPGSMKKKPRKTNESIFNGQMISQTLVSGLTIGLIGFAFWHYMINIAMHDEFYARSMLFLLFVLMQNVHVFNCRSEYSSAFQVPLGRNRLLILGVLAANGIHIISTHIPFMQQLLRVQPVTLSEWLSVMMIALIIIVVMELFKLAGKKSLANR